MKKDVISKELLKEMAKDISRHILKIDINMISQATGLTIDKIRDIEKNLK